MAKNPLIASALSLIVTGLGQIYLGRYLRAFYFFSMGLFGGLIYVEYSQSIGLFVSMSASLWSVYDAYALAKKTNSAPSEDRGETKKTDQPEVRVF